MSPEPVGVRGPYAKSVAVQRRIVDAALEVFAETGYRATTMKAVAERAGISQRGLVHHFPSKEDLLAGVLADFDAQVAQNLPAREGLDGIRGLIRTAMGDAAKPAILELYLIMSAEAAAPDHPAHDHYRHRYETFRRFLTECFTQIRDQGQLASEIEPATLAILFTGLMDGLQSQWLYDREQIDIAASLNRFLDEILVGTSSRLADKR